MLSRLVLRRKLDRSPPFALILKRPSNNGVHQRMGWFENTSMYAQKQWDLLKSTMVTQSKFEFQLPFKSEKNVHMVSLSDLAGHASFMFLAVSYMESDFLKLRLFAVSGVTLSIIFQYYRERPLWIPIRWNSLFLFINAVMIAFLLKEERDAENIPIEKKLMYESTFMRKGMKPVDFLYLCSAAERCEVKKGEVIVSEKLKNTRVYLVKSGKLSVHQNGVQIRTIQANQFVGSMSFLGWEDKIDAAKLQRKLQKDTLKNWSNKNSDTELFLPFLILIEHILDRLELRKPHEHHHDCKKCQAKATSPPSSANATVTGSKDTVLDTIGASSFDAESNGGFLADWHLFEEVPASELQELQDEAPYGISVDENGNVVTDETFFYSEDSGVAGDQQPSVFGTYLTSTYNYIAGVVSPTPLEKPEMETSAGNNIVPAGAEGMLGYADVIVEEDCVLYYWSFERLRALIELYPSLGLAFERALSEDINKKMSSSMQTEPLQRYQLMLSGAVSGGETSEMSMQILSDFRNKYKISPQDHTDMLEKLGWTAHDFSSGFKNAPALSVQQQYLMLLSTALEGTNDAVLTEEKRTELRVFRKRNNITSSNHLAALRKLSWTVDEYEIGSKNPDHASQKEVRAQAANEVAQRRGRIRAALFSMLPSFEFTATPSPAPASPSSPSSTSTSTSASSESSKATSVVATSVSALGDADSGEA